MTGISYEKSVQHSFTEIFDLLQHSDWELSKHSQLVTKSGSLALHYSLPTPSHVRIGARP